jgi:hypothetical protein
VWYGFAGGSVRSIGSPFDTKCLGECDCFEGSKCIQTGPIRQCFFKNPYSEDKNFKLDTGASKDVNIPIFDNGLDIIWSGAITGRTGCDANGMNCKTADCGTDDVVQGACKASQGFMQPAVQAEITMSKLNVDFYDVEVINGVHIGVSMNPINGETTSNPYNCGNPGAKFPKNQSSGSCNWDMKPPSNDYQWVTAGGAHCQLDLECKEHGTTCGISFNPGHVDLLKKTCGSLLGYWSADQICGVIPSFGAPFHCQDHLPAPHDGLTLFNLYACVGVGSCY